jgi:vancomycin permeability regulator SanA
MHEHVVRSAAGHLFEVDAVPAADTAIVLGARIDPDGTPFPMLADRLQTAAALWHGGKARRLLLSGDGSSSPGYDEIAVMRRWLVARGVPASALIEDRAGLRTLDSMYRARDVFGLDRAIVVSNPFHVPRAVFLGRQHGLDVVGVGAAPGHPYSPATLGRNHGRELVARVWAWLDVFVFGTCAGAGI